MNLMINQKFLLNDANNFFLKKDFSKALFLYSQLSTLYPSNDDYQVYAIFCDIANEDENKALSLFDYYAVSKEDDEESALEDIYKMINMHDDELEDIMEMLNKITKDSIESLDAIKYEDFKQFIISRGSFKEAFEDIMFSTKVAIESKEDFFDFVSNLIENGFDSTAYNYLENFNEHFTYDDKVEDLYKLLEEKKIVINN